LGEDEPADGIIFFPDQSANFQEQQFDYATPTRLDAVGNAGPAPALHHNIQSHCEADIHRYPYPDTVTSLNPYQPSYEKTKTDPRPVSLLAP
jgi:hypothetical protein